MVFIYRYHIAGSGGSLNETLVAYKCIQVNFKTIYNSKSTFIPHAAFA